MNSRRHFLIQAPVALLGAVAACRADEQKPGAGGTTSATPTPGAPPAFNTAPPVGPEVSPATFSEAEKLVQVQMTDAQRQMMAKSWRTSMAALLERRTGPRKIALEPTLAPATRWEPASIVRPTIAGAQAARARDHFVRSAVDPGPLPTNDADIAYAPVTQLARWIETRKLTSTRLTQIYLDRIQRYDTKLRCVITLTRDAALAQAKQADAEIAAGRYRGPLHGIPYGVKDLLDTAAIATTYGAEPFQHRVPNADSTVVARLKTAGAVLIAKLSMGALALNDIWFGGQTMNPWLLEEGASGSRPGPGAATAPAPPALSIGNQTGGSIR